MVAQPAASESPAPSGGQLGPDLVATGFAGLTALDQA